MSAPAPTPANVILETVPGASATPAEAAAQLVTAAVVQNTVAGINLGENITLPTVTVPDDFEQELAESIPVYGAEGTSATFDSLNTYSGELTSFINSETLRMEALSKLYNSYDKLAISKNAIDGATPTLKDGLLEHLKRNIQLVQTNQNLTASKQTELVAKLEGDQTVAVKARTVRTNNDATIGAHIKTYSVPKNE